MTEEENQEDICKIDCDELEIHTVNPEVMAKNTLKGGVLETEYDKNIQSKRVDQRKVNKEQMGLKKVGR